MLRVSMLTSWNDRCGIAEYSRRLVEALRARAEVEVVPASFRRTPKSTYAAMGQALNGGEVAHVQHSYAFFGGMHPLRSGWGALAGAVSRPLLLTVHELDDRVSGPYPVPPQVELAYKRRFNRSVFLHPAVKGWMVHSLELQEALIKLGAPADRIWYCPMPVPPPPGREPEPERARRSLRLDGSRALVIVGFLARRKGYDLALDALRELPPEWVLVAAGGEHAADRTGTQSWLREEAARRGLADRLRITGYLSEEALDDVTAAAEAVLAPFREMSASASLNYALARRKIVIASDLPENRVLPCVRLFPTGEAPALAAAVRKVSTDSRERRSLLDAVDRYAAEHSYTALAEETAGIYRRLLDEAA